MDRNHSENYSDLLELLSQSQDDAAVTPYNGSSGWSGTETSKGRADLLDRSGETAFRQRAVMDILAKTGQNGITWKELSELTEWHHGVSSGTLSVLHKAGEISRLTEKRRACRVYVSNDNVHGRETDSHGRKRKACPNCGHDL